MHVLHAIREAATQTRRRILVAGVVVVAAALGTASVCYVVTDAADRHDRTAAALASPTARSILIRSTRPDGAPLPAALCEAVAALDGVSHAVSLDRASSARNALWPRGSTPVGLFHLRVLAGPEPYRLVDGRRPDAGAAIVARAARATLGFAPGAPGTITVDGDVPRLLGVVGTFEVPDDLGAIRDLLNAAAVAWAAPDDGPQLLALVVQQPSDVVAVTEAARIILGGLPAQSYTVEFDARTADVERTIREAGRRGARALAVGLAAASAGVIGLVSFMHTLVRRRDIGRQRALGRTRTDIALTITVQTALLSALGALAGASAAAAALAHRSVEADVSVLASAAVLVTIIAALASLPAAAFGALRDPAALLRVP